VGPVLYSFLRAPHIIARVAQLGLVQVLCSTNNYLCFSKVDDTYYYNIGEFQNEEV